MARFKIAVFFSPGPKVSSKISRFRTNLDRAATRGHCRHFVLDSEEPPFAPGLVSPAVAVGTGRLAGVFGLWNRDVHPHRASRSRLEGRRLGSGLIRPGLLHPAIRSSFVLLHDGSAEQPVREPLRSPFHALHVPSPPVFRPRPIADHSPRDTSDGRGGGGIPIFLLGRRRGLSERMSSI